MTTAFSVPLLSVRGLKKYFPIVAGLLRRQVGCVRAVDGLDFDVHAGEVVGLVGESGSGKSTAARTAIRLLEPTAGTVCYEGQDIASLGRQALRRWRRHVQMVFQDPYASLNPRIRVGDALGEPLEYHGLVNTGAERSERVLALLNMVGLDKSALERYPHAFSGGQQQRICIARALALEPKLLVCDEALSALDVSIQAQILNLLSSLRERLKLSYLFITHDLATVRYFCNTVLVLYSGQVMESAPTERIFSHPCHPYTRALLAATPCQHPRDRKTSLPIVGGSSGEGSSSGSSSPPGGCPFMPRCPYAEEACRNPIPWREASPGHHFRCIKDL